MVSALEVSESEELEVCLATQDLIRSENTQADNLKHSILKYISNESEKTTRFKKTCFNKWHQGERKRKNPT